MRCGKSDFRRVDQGLSLANAVTLPDSVELDATKQAHVPPRLQHLVLLEGDAVADVVVEQVFAPEPDGHLGDNARLLAHLEGVAELGIHKVVAGGWRIEGGELVLREGVQQVDPGEPVGIAASPVDSSNTGTCFRIVPASSQRKPPSVSILAVRRAACRVDKSGMTMYWTRSM